MDPDTLIMPHICLHWGGLGDQWGGSPMAVVCVVSANDVNSCDSRTRSR